MDSHWTTNGQLRLEQYSIDQESLSKNKSDQDSINRIVNTEGIMTEQQLIQAIYIEKIKDRNPNNIIDCVGYLKYLPIEVIKAALEKTSIQLNPEWNYAKDLLDNYVRNGTTNIGESFVKDGFKRKGDEILNG